MRDGYAYGGRDVHASNVHASNVHASDVHASNVHASNAMCTLVALGMDVLYRLPGVKKSVYT